VPGTTEAITYTWVETPVAGYQAPAYTTAGNVTTVINTANAPAPEPEPIDDTEYTLTINYIFLGGGQAAPTATITGVTGTAYNVANPVIAGFTPVVGGFAAAAVAGTIGNADQTITVIYVANPAPDAPDGDALVEIDDFETPLGLGDVFINTGECCE
jgi:hypothetical protein